MVVNQTQGDTERLMKDGQAAAKRGDKVMARALLTQVLELDPHNEQAWMWLSGAVADPAEQRTCLENVLILNPNSAAARKGLDFLEGKPVTPNTPKPTAMLEPNGSAPRPEMPYPDTSPVADPPVFEPPDQSYVEPMAAAPTSPAPSSSMDAMLWPKESGTEVLGGTRGEVQPSMFPGTDFNGSDPSQPFDPALFDPSLVPGAPNAYPAFEGSDAFNVQPDMSFGDFDMPSESVPTVPDWVTSLSGGAPTVQEATVAKAPTQPAFPEPSTTQVLPYDAEHALSEMQAAAAAAAAQDEAQQPNQAGAGHEADLNAWLEDLQSAAKPFNFSDSQETSGGSFDFGAEQHDPMIAGSAFPSDPMMGSGPSGFDVKDPFFGAQLPSPDELPGGGAEEADVSQPWYLRSSNESTSSAQRFDDNYSLGYPTDDGPQQPRQSAPPAPVTMVHCPNCQTEVPDTTLACPECRYSFFVHCPHCHELLDTTNAREGVIEGCPYCAAQVNRLDLGRSGATGVVRPIATPRETKLQWTGNVDAEPKRRSFAATFGWLVDLMWLMVIVLMVWALTQLPAWLNLTDLYN